MFEFIFINNGVEQESVTKEQDKGNWELNPLEISNQQSMGERGWQTDTDSSTSQSVTESLLGEYKPVSFLSNESSSGFPESTANDVERHGWGLNFCFEGF